MPAQITRTSERRRNQNARALKRQVERDAKADLEGKFGSPTRDELEEEDGEYGEDGEEAETEWHGDGGREEKLLSGVNGEASSFLIKSS